jgi:hypothetical protein
MMLQKSSQGQPSVIRQNQALGCLGFWPPDRPQSILCIRTVALLSLEIKRAAFDSAGLSACKDKRGSVCFTSRRELLSPTWNCLTTSFAQRGGIARGSVVRDTA